MTSFFTLDFKFGKFDNEFQDKLTEIREWFVTSNMPETIWGYSTVQHPGTFYIHLQIIVDAELAALQFKLAWADYILPDFMRTSSDA